MPAHILQGPRIFFNLSTLEFQCFFFDQNEGRGHCIDELLRFCYWWCFTRYGFHYHMWQDFKVLIHFEEEHVPELNPNVWRIWRDLEGILLTNGNGIWRRRIYACLPIVQCEIQEAMTFSLALLFQGIILLINYLLDVPQGLRWMLDGNNSRRYLHKCVSCTW